MRREVRKYYEANGISTKRLHAELIAEWFRGNGWNLDITVTHTEEDETVFEIPDEQTTFLILKFT